MDCEYIDRFSIGSSTWAVGGEADGRGQLRTIWPVQEPEAFTILSVFCWLPLEGQVPFPCCKEVSYSRTQGHLRVAFLMSL